MEDLWSIRMRASKKLVTRHSSLVTPKEIHISGAEGIYRKPEIQKIVKQYIERALNHPRGKADKIVITIEEIKEKPKTIPALPIVTIKNSSPREGEIIVGKLLQLTGISKRAIDTAFELIKKDGMRGAAIITGKNGKRLEPDRERGIRVSRLGITKSALKELAIKLSRLGINTETVKEALILASKVSASKDVVAELCISDDPNYTTGYMASKGFGYVRIPNIKDKGSRNGGRAFFVREGADFRGIVEYLERRPVIIGKVSSCKGRVLFDGIKNHHYI
jgi:6-carboxyhexanoate--CoA ligase